MCLFPVPPDHRGWLDLSQWVHERWRRWRVVGPRIHSVPGTVQQLVHLAVGQRRQRKGPVQMFHVQGSPEQRDICCPLLTFCLVPSFEFASLIYVFIECLLSYLTVFLYINFCFPVRTKIIQLHCILQCLSRSSKHF